MSEFNLNIFNLIIVSGVLHGLIFSAIIFANKKYNSNNIIYLGFVVLFLSLSNLQYWLIDTQIIEKISSLKYIFIPWQWLVLPMFYLYVHYFIGKSQLRKTVKRLLFGPFIFVLIIFSSLNIYAILINTTYDVPSHFQRGIYVYLEFLSIAFNIVMMYVTYKLIVQYEEDTSYNIKWVKSETNWLKKLIYWGFGICICWVIAISLVAIFNLNYSHLFYPMWIGISILVYWIGYVGITKSQQLKNRIALRKKRIGAVENKNAQIENKPSTFDRIKDLIRDQKIYMNPNLSLEMLSEELQLSEGYISQLFTKNTSPNFNDYINQLRVEDTKVMLLDSDYDNYTIESIGLESGFNSKSSFYSSFKKFTGKTPLEYKKSIRKS